MDLNRTLLAVALSLIILLGWQYLFAPPVPEQPPEAQPQSAQGAPSARTDSAAAPQEQPAPAAAPLPVETVEVDPAAKDITVDTPLYTAVISEQGGAIKSFKLKQYRAGIAKDSGPMELAPADNPAARPLIFSTDNGATAALPLYKTQGSGSLRLEQGSIELVMTARLPDGLELTRTMRFSADSYLMPVRYTLRNTGTEARSVTPALIWNCAPFPHENPPSSYLFAGPMAYVDGEYLEVADKELRKGPLVRQGALSWAAYSDSYFISAVMPEGAEDPTLTVQAAGVGQRLILASGAETLEPGAEASRSYTLYMGPKKLATLQKVGHNLAQAVDYGWFTLIAKPMLWLLNFFYLFTRNYGIAIILLTIVIRGAFWPITQKGMKSMKNMQKLQPKINKLREKFKDDPAKMNQEMMNLYKTYKVNPLGGCLPMLIQFPFFIALYRVLLQAIELRHAPFMLWINDLSMPDRLWMGFDIPYLHGLPVLTLLMGASMYLQQKMTPTPAADPTQVRIMQWLPLIFTFMFINFASGLVLYWFVNNLLSMLQQYLINRTTVPAKSGTPEKSGSGPA